jgi:hypothetical protein
MRLSLYRFALVPAVFALLCLTSFSSVHAASAADALAAYVVQSGHPADAERGRQFFTTTHGRDWSCASCHSAQPIVPGKHASTGKVIAPMAPAFQPDRFTDNAKTEKWFRRNCNDVVGRECSATEKADVLAWLMTFKR